MYSGEHIASGPGPTVNLYVHFDGTYSGLGAVVSLYVKEKAL